ncbi:protein PF14_0175-like [Lucilia sericata]|uniref:protein PF14_0175-like n=1 Tax=Lucilia sericata TaxID=13632 RepID=UPI0018A80DCD|nr:protein PF14_0175-like [Lucilia sericata]
MSTITKPRVPDGLRELMKDLTREILKEKPTDIYDFAESYFQSRLPEKENYVVKSFEESSGKYDFSYIQNPQRYQIPVALVYSIIPEGLTNLIKDLIKAVLREQPTNLCDFAVEYFRHIKAATCKESQAETKEINYSAYEKYFMNKERFLFTPYVKCTCGRTLGEAYSNNSQIEHLIAIHKIQNNDSTFLSKSLVVDDSKNNNNLNKITENDTIYNEKYMNSIYIIQRYIRRYLKGKKDTTKTNQVSPNHKTFDHHSVTAKPIITKQYEHTSQIPIVPQLQLNQNESENISEDASYNSASTAVLSASESSRETSEPSMYEKIVTKTIMEDIEMENDEKNISSQSTRNHVQDDTSTKNNEKEGVSNVNDADGSKDSAKSLDYIMDSRNEEFDSKEIETMKNLNESGEANEQPVEDIDIKGKTNVESKTDIEAINAAVSSIETVNVNLTQPEIFNINIEKTNEKTSDIGELHKISVDVHDADIKSHDNDLKKDKSFSEHELIAENKITEHDNNSNESTEADDKEFSKEVDQADLTGSFGNNNLETVDKYPMLEKTKITELLESIKEKTSDDNKSDIETNEEDNDAEKLSKDSDNNVKKEDVDDSFNKKLSDFDRPTNVKEEMPTQLDTNNSASTIIASNPKFEGDIMLGETKEADLGNLADQMLKSKNDFVEKALDMKLDKSILIQPKNNDDGKTSESTKNDDEIKLENEKFKIDGTTITHKIDEIITESEFDKNVNNTNKLGDVASNKQETSRATAEYELNKNSDLTDQTPLQQKTDTSIVVREKSPTKSSDSNDKNLIEKSEIILDKGNSPIMLDKEMDLKHDKKSDDTIELNELGNKPILIQQKNNDEGKTSELTKTDFENESENEKFDTDETTMTNKTDKIITESEFDKNVNNENKSEDVASNNQETSRATAEDELNKNSDLTDQNSLQEKNTTNTNIAEIEKEINDGKKIDVEKQDRNIEESQRNELADSTNKNISVDTDDKVLSETKMDEKYSNQGENDQTELKMQDSNTQNLMNYNINLNTKSEQSIVDTVEKRAKNELDNDLKRVFKSKSDEIMNNSDEIGSKANVNMNKYNRTSHTSDEANYNDNKVDISSNLDNNGLNTVEEKSLIESKIKDEITDINNRGNVKENITLVEKNTNTDDMKFNKEFIQTEIETKVVPDELNEILENDKNPKKHEVDKIIESSIEVDNNKKVATSVQEPTKVDLNEKTKESLNMHMEKECDNNMGVKETEIENSGYNKNLECSFKMDLDNNTTSKNENITLTSENLTQEQQSESNIANAAIEPTNQKETKIIENKKNIQTDVESSRNDNDIKTEKYVTTDDQEPTHVDLNEKTIESLNMNIEKDSVSVKDTEIDNSEYGKNLEGSFKTSLDKNTSSIEENINLTSENLTQKHQSESNLTNTAIEPEIIQKEYIQTEIESHRNDNDFKTEEHVTANVQEPNQVDLNEKTNESLNMNIEKESDNNVGDIETEIDNSGYDKIALDKNTTSMVENINMTSENLTQKQQSESNLTNAALEPTNQEEINILQKENIQTEVKSRKNDTDIKTEEDDVNKTNVIYENSKDIPAIKTNSELLMEPSDENLLEYKNSSTNYISSDLQNKNVDTKPELQFRSNDDEFESRVQNELNTHLPKTSQTEQNETNYKENIDQNANYNLDESTAKTNLKDELSKKFTENKNETATSDASEVSKEISPSKLEDKRDNKFESDLKIDHTLNKTEKLTAISNSNLLKESSQTKSDEICNESCVEIIKKSETDDIVNTTNANNKDKFSSVMQETKLDSFDANSINISNNKDETTNNENVKTILKDSSINDSNMTDELIDKTFTLKSSGSIDNEEVNRNLVETLQTELDKNKTNVNVDNTIADAHVTEEIITKNCAQETQAEKHLNEGKETTTNIRNIEPSENDIDVGTDKQTTDPDDITSSEISSKQLVDSSEKSINRAKQPTKDASSISENENYIKSETVISDTNEHCDNITTENQESVSTSNKHQNTNLSEAIIEKCDTKHPVSELYGTDTGASTNSLSIENEQSQPFEIQSDISKQEKSINDDYEQKEIKSNSFTKRADERRNTTNESNSGEDQELIVENKTKSQEQQLGNLDVAYSDSIEANDGNIGTTNSAGHEQNNQANSDVIKANYKDMDTINSSDDTAGIVTDDRINNTLQLKNDSNTSFSNDIIEHETETKQIQEPQESEPEIETNKSSLEFSNNKLHLEDKPLKDLNEVNQDIQTISKYQESSEGHEKKSSITLDTNIAQNDEEKTNFDIKTRNSIQIEQDLNDDQGVRDNHKEENNQNTEINMDDSNSELIAEKSSNLEDNVIKTNSNNENIHDDKEISKISLKSEEIETHNDEDFNSQSRNKREVENDQNSEHKDSNELSDTKQIITIHDDDELKQMSGENPVLRLTDENVIGENVHSNKGETIQQDSIENISDSSEVKTPLNVLEIETPSEQDSVSTDYIKTSSVNVNDQEINSQTIFSDNKSLDLNMNKLQSSVSDTEVSSLDVHQQQSTLENEQNPENEVNAENQKHTGASSSFPLEKESIYKENPSNLIKSSSSNKLEDNQPNKIEKENVDPSTVKHIEKIESTSNEISNIQQDVTLDGTSKDNTLENNSNYELLSTEEIQEHQENESNNKIEAKTSNLNSSIDQTFHGDQKDKLHTENINENETVHQYKVDRENIIEGTQADAKDIKTANVNESSQEDFKQENTVQRNTNVTAETTNNEETTQNIGIQTSETFIGNQNLTIGRIRNFNEGLLGSISGQRFAETHLKSFWKEYVMNNSMPLSQYDYKENEPKEQPAAGTSRQQNMNQVNETNLSANKSEEQTIDIIEPEIIKETIKQSESSPVKNENISTANNDSTPSKDIERIPRYFYGVPDTEPSHSSSCSKRKSYKEPTAFTIAIGDLNKKHNTKIAKTVEGLSPKSNKDVECQKSDIKHNLTKFDLSDKVYAEPLLESETPPKVFQDLNEFEYEIHDIDLDITYTIDEIIRLKIENDSQNNSDDNDANETSEYSLTPEPMLQTIVELSESETPKPPDQLHSIDDDFLANLERISDTTSTSWTTGSKEDNSFISDEFLDEKSQSEYIK